MKKCTQCGKLKNLTDFGKNKEAKDGYSLECKTCASARHKNYCGTCKEKIANGSLIRNYGITLENKRSMWREQGGRCAICKKKLIDPCDCCVDHCHITGVIRGMLCSGCNYGLGCLQDDPIILQAAINYLKKK
jgi:hypothetical protein